jgi:hypothetical protein
VSHPHSYPPTRPTLPLIPCNFKHTKFKKHQIQNNQVYIGSFNSDAPINAAKNPHCVELFEAEQAQLLHDLYEIPSRSCDRKVHVCV